MKYRIKIVTNKNGTSYFPQYRIFPFIWSGQYINGNTVCKTRAQAIDLILGHEDLNQKEIEKITTEIIDPNYFKKDF